MVALIVPLTKGYVAVVDEGDAWVLDHKWYANVQGGGKVYAARKLNGKRSLLHKELMSGIPRVDHEDGDTLNDRRGNLRSCTAQTNLQNLGGPRKDNTSGFLGVTPVKSGRWRAHIRHQGKRLNLGTYDSPEEANRARLSKEQELWGIHPRRKAAHA